MNLIEIYPQQVWGGSRHIELRMLNRETHSPGVLVRPDRYEHPRHLVTGFVQTEYVEGQTAEPVAHMELDSAQRLMDTLWNLGIRPVASQGSAGQLDAVQKHLADMRAIAFNKLSVPEPTR